MQDYEVTEVWFRLIEKLNRSISGDNFRMYINQMKPAKIEDNTLIATVTSQTLKNAIEQKFLSIMNGILTEITDNKDFNMVIRIDEKNRNSINVPKENYETVNLFKDEPEEEKFESHLNSNQRFDNFVVGNSNRFACAAAQAVATKKLAEAYNPLFIYGASGLGKTHLMQAIGNALLANNPQLKILYLTSETFTNEIINSIQNKTTEAFRKKYRNIDCLIIDDIQFLKNKEMTQEEFFHTFNTLKEANKQIIISSDRPPKDMANLEDRLRSRFASGLTADIQPPDLETRIAILRKKAELENINLPNDVIQLIASSISSNIRMIEGAYTRIVAYSDLMKVPIDTTIALNVLNEFSSEKPPAIITADKIIKYVCAYYKIKTEDFLSKKRPKNIATPRQIGMYLCRTMTDSSLPKIGEAFGGRDHTTVIHACEKILKMRREDKVFDKMMNDFQNDIRTK